MEYSQGENSNSRNGYGHKHSKETRIKIGLANSDKVRTPEVVKEFTKMIRAKYASGEMIAWNKGRPFLEIRGGNHYNWKGDNTSYNKIHDWIRRYWKKPGTCERCKKISKKIDWSNNSGKYLRSDRSDWEALCRSCHVKKDGNKNQERLNNKIIN